MPETPETPPPAPDADMTLPPPPPEAEERSATSSSGLDALEAVSDVAVIGEAIMAGLDGAGAVVAGIAEGVGAIFSLFDS